MLTRNLILPVVITAAIGMPLLMSNSGTDPDNASGYDLPYDGYGEGSPFFPGNQLGPDLAAGSMEFSPVSDLSTVFSFDHTVDGIRSGYQRLSVVAGENGWQGLRTDLVTGTGAADLHGCITWFFDSKGRMQRIAFRGWTGDCQNLKKLLSDRFLLTDSGKSGVREMMRLGSWGSTTSAAVFQLPNEIRQDQPRQQYAVTLELNRSSSYSVSPAMQAALQ